MMAKKDTQGEPLESEKITAEIMARAGKSAVLDAIVVALADVEVRRKCLETFRKADDSGDFYHVHATEFIEGGGNEIRMVLRAVASVIKPNVYIEVGTRFGWSAAQVWAEMSSDTPLLMSVDMWQEGYAGLETKGSDYAMRQIVKMGGKKSARPMMIDADSHDVLPGIGRAYKADLVTIDADHRASGTWFDLVDMLPSVRVGGVLVTDDLFPTAHEGQLGLAPAVDKFGRPPYPIKEYSLLHLWRALPALYPDFIFYDEIKDDTDLSAWPFGVAPVGIAVRVK